MEKGNVVLVSMHDAHGRRAQTHAGVARSVRAPSARSPFRSPQPPRRALSARAAIRSVLPGRGCDVQGSLIARCLLGHKVVGDWRPFSGLGFRRLARLRPLRLLVGRV